ncbi:MAG: phosphate ABC transporter ATP-binding protein [Neomegalonema sp.]|nr:phosphate ABC transporter ATP-binding protein [Neomegalonema sp.]
MLADASMHDHLSEELFVHLNPEQEARLANAPAKIDVRDLNFWYGETHALKKINLPIVEGAVTAFIGPSGCGKSTLLKCFNRMHDVEADARHTGEILMRGPAGLMDAHDEHIDPPLLRRRFGWVAQKPNPFPSSVYDNIAYPATLHGLTRSRRELNDHVREMLEAASMWDEMKDRLHESGADLSGGQQQRLCIARALSPRPEVLLMDEPCGSLDPISTERVEALIHKLRGTVTIVIITHNMEEAARVSDFVAFFKLGEMLEYGPAKDVLLHPKNPECLAYLTGQFG